MSQGSRFKGWEIFEISTSIKSWLLKLVSLFYIDIHFWSFVNEGHSVDTQFCTPNLTLGEDQNNHSKYPKIMIALHVSSDSSHIIKMILRFLRSRQYAQFPNCTVRLKDMTRSSFNGLHTFIWVKLITHN